MCTRADAMKRQTCSVMEWSRGKSSHKNRQGEAIYVISRCAAAQNTQCILPKKLSYLQAVAAACIMQHGLCSLEQVSMATIYLSSVWIHARLLSMSAGLLLLSYSKDEALQAA